MKLLQLSLLLATLQQCFAAQTAQAIFNPATTGLDGTVTVLNGFVEVDLDFSGVDESLLPTNTCFVGGLTYHIHDSWNHDNLGDRLNSYVGDTMCNSSYTGGHWDPWLACGPSSGNDDCKHNGGCVPPSTSWWGDNTDEDYKCNSTYLDLVPYTCEVGDWSGKYGRLNVDATDTTTIYRVDGAFWESSHLNLAPSNSYSGGGFYVYRSLVIHCGDGQRAFCAAFQWEQASFNEVALEGNQVVSVDFDYTDNDLAVGDFTGLYINISSEGYTVVIPEDSSLSCNSWYLYLHEEWTDYSVSAAQDDDCTDLVGKIWDPTHSCIDGSSSPYCNNGTRCNGTEVDYAADCLVDELNYPYSCAVGDVGGRIGIITYGDAGGSMSSANLTGGVDAVWTQTYEDDASPPIYAIAGRSVRLVCQETDAEVSEICAPTFQIAGDLVTDSPIGGDGDDPTTTAAAPPTMRLYGALLLTLFIAVWTV